MLAGLATAWWHASAGPSTDTFSHAISGKSHLKTLAGVVVAAAFGVGLSWVVDRLLHDPAQEFMGLASVWVKSGTPAPVWSWVVVVPLALVQQVVAVIPGVGRPLFVLVAAGSLIPTTTSLKTAHGYSTVRAVLT